MKQPILFIGHGSPMNIIEDNHWTRKWESLGKDLPQAKAILMISAHWYTRGTRIQTNPNPEMFYDMYGFPEELYEYVYPAKTDPELIRRVTELLSPLTSVQEDANRGYDHGGYSVLSKTHPEAKIPVVQLSVDRTLTARAWFQLGQALAPLRDEGYLIFASGNILHNLRMINLELGSQAYDICRAFDESISIAVTALASDEKKDRDAALAKVLDLENLPGVEVAAASPDHLAPFFYALGAAVGKEPVNESIHSERFCQDYMWGTVSMTSYLFA